MIKISHSDISSFLRCKRQWNWGYVADFVAPERLYGPLACGSRVHAAINLHHTTDQNAVEIHERLVQLDEQAMKSIGQPDWAFREFYNDAIMGRNCCIAYLAWIETEGPYDGYILLSEEAMEMPICNGRAILRGKADLVLTRESDGVVFTDDYKTASPHTRTSLPPTLERSYQHHVYAALSNHHFPDRRIGGSYYTILYKSKAPGRMTHPMIERLPIHAHASSTPIKLRQIEQIVSDMLDTMERLETIGPQVAYPSPGDSCRWCDFKHPCTMQDENPLGARAMLDAEFNRGGRHARYDDPNPTTQGE